LGEDPGRRDKRRKNRGTWEDGKKKQKKKQEHVEINPM
jgi:hypothetical protein